DHICRDTLARHFAQPQVPHRWRLDFGVGEGDGGDTSTNRHSHATVVEVSTEAALLWADRDRRDMDPSNSRLTNRHYCTNWPAAVHDDTLARRNGDLLVTAIFRADRTCRNTLACHFAQPQIPDRRW